jgi:hypothetical protein
VARSATSSPVFLRTWLIWPAGFLAFPSPVWPVPRSRGRVDRPLSALTGGRPIPGAKT